MKKIWVFYHMIIFQVLILLVACTTATEQSFVESATNGNDSAPALLTLTDTPGGEGIELPTPNSGDTSNDSILRDDVETAVLIYERRSGLKGVGPSVREWRFYGDGRIVGSDGSSWQVESTIIASLVAEITASGFQNLDNSYIPEDTCCDRTTHMIVVQMVGQTYAVETLDDADMPKSLEDNLRKINNFLMDLYE